MADSQHSLPLPPQDPEVVAAADLGSNSFHLVVAEVRRG